MWLRQMDALSGLATGVVIGANPWRSASSETNLVTIMDPNVLYRWEDLPS
jgi:hypothetical protein